MPPKLWNRAGDLLLEALEREPAERDAFLDDACGGDASLRSEIDSLLSADAGLLDRLDQPAFRLLQTPSGGCPRGWRLGPYEVIEEIGRGGTGEVYLAVRSDGEYQRRVAIKVLKRGMDTEDLVRRFRRERQILANLNHPSIAELHDGGTAPDGRPYLVMEHVEGEPIDRFCERCGLGIRERLELFLKVCAAVQVAHQNLVVHRDLKPSNILVGPDGEPKLLDFGIAKLLAPGSGLATTATGEGVRPMTPAYASPEQVRGEPVTTACDVYSLGVLLFQLLTGHRPYELRGASTDEVRRTICEREPERPSQVVAGREMRRRLAGDLDAIVATALRKEPARRYTSVERLAGEIRRHLAGLPVAARRSTFAYRGAKFLRRHTRAAAATAAGALLLLGFALDRELQGRRMARERDRAEEVSAFLEELFEVSGPAEERRDLKARELLDRGTAKLAASEPTPELAAALRLTLGKGYRSLSLTAEATPLLEEALEIRRSLHGEHSLEVAEALYELALLEADKGRPLRAEALIRDALEMERTILGTEDSRFWRTLNARGAVLMDQGEYERAEPLIREALASHLARAGGETPSTAALRSNLGAVLYYRGELEEAGEQLRLALETAVELHGEEDGLVSAGKLNLAAVLCAEGRLDEAERLEREVLDVYLRTHGEEHPAVATALSNLALLLHDKGELEAAEGMAREALRQRVALLGESHPTTATARANLATVLESKGEFLEAEALARQALASLEEVLPPTHWRLAKVGGLVGAALAARGRFEEAEHLLLDAFAVLREARGERSLPTRAVLERLVRLYESWQRPEDAARYRELLRAAEPPLVRDPALSFPEELLSSRASQRLATPQPRSAVAREMPSTAATSGSVRPQK